MGMQFAQHAVKHTAQLSVMQAAYDAQMQIEDPGVADVRPYRLARKANLTLLIKEAGGPSQLARECDIPKSHISAITHGARNVGDDLASKLESVMGKPPGWMDQSHEGAALIAEPQQPATIGQAAMALGAAVAGLSESRRKTISALVAAQIYDKPDSQEALAIDALTPGLTVAVPAGWRDLAHRTATSHPDAAVREILTKFVDEIDRQARAESHAPAHQAKSILKI